MEIEKELFLNSHSKKVRTDKCDGDTDVQFECPHLPPQLLLSVLWLSSVQQLFLAVSAFFAVLQQLATAFFSHAKVFMGARKKHSDMIKIMLMQYDFILQKYKFALTFISILTKK